jgi:hypothetical protein
MSINYRTRDGQADYKFSFEQQANGDWRAYILSQPSYRSRATDSHSTHRLTDYHGRKYVCWSTPISSADGLKNVVAKWSDATQDYIKYGTRF